MLAEILAELRRADAQPEDWYGWLTNQAAHMALVGIPAAMLMVWLQWPSWAIPLAVALIYGVGWELVVQRGKDFGDSIMDTAFVACGAALTVAMFSDPYEAARVFTVFAFLLAYGVGKRI